MIWDDRIRRRLKLRDLDTLLAVAQWGSMAKAAAHLAVSQPAVSNAVVEVERTLGVQLFDRTPQGVEPTIYGRALLKWAVVVFDDVRQGVKEIEYLADPHIGELRIGANDPMIGGLLTAVLDHFCRRHPGVNFQVKAASGIDRLYEELRGRNVDVVLGRVLSEAADDLTMEVLFDDPLSLVVSARSPWARARKIELSRLIDEAWALPRPETTTGVYMTDVFRRTGLRGPRTIVMCNSIENRIALLATGRFVGVLPRSVLTFGAKTVPLKVLPIRLPTQSAAPFGLVTVKNRTISPLAQVFNACVRTIAKPLAT